MVRFFYSLVILSFLLVSCGPTGGGVTSTTTTTTIMNFETLPPTVSVTITNVTSTFNQDGLATVAPLDVVVQVSDSLLLGIGSNTDYQLKGNTLSFHLEPGAGFQFQMAPPSVLPPTFGDLLGAIENITVTSQLTGKSSQTTGSSMSSLPNSRTAAFIGLIDVRLFADSFFL